MQKGEKEDIGRKRNENRTEITLAARHVLSTVMKGNREKYLTCYLLYGIL